MKDGFLVLDADRHSMDPSTFWGPYLEPQYRGRVTAVGDVQLVDGKPFSRMHAPEPRSGFRGWSNTPPYQEAFREALAEGFSPAANLRDMDREGVDVAVLFPSYGLSMTFMDDIDPQLGAAICRAYNTWIAAYCNHAPGRVKAVALAPVYEPARAIEELQRAKEQLGLVGVMWRPNPIKGRTFTHPDYYPIYEACAALDLPILVHEGSDTTLNQAGSDRYSTFTRHIACHPIEQMLACLQFCADGLLERFPGLRVGFMEAGCGWAPYWVERMDEHWENYYFGKARATKEPPSYYFHRQCFVSCEAGEALIPCYVTQLGEDTLVTATDYPHPDAIGKFPERTVGDLTGNRSLSASTKQSVLWENPARLFGIEAPSVT